MQSDEGIRHFIRARLRPDGANQGARTLAMAGAGVRAQAVRPDGKLEDDFCIRQAERMVHVLNAPSPAATASISIGRTIAGMAVKNFGLSTLADRRCA